MCGIAGFYGSPNWELSPRRVLERMLAAIRYRGPDDWGVHLDGPVGLGHVRLSIIDLAGGRQPMADESNTVWVTFNGEIFNYVELRAELISAGHRFRTNSDTEVILEAYRRKGLGCVEDFNGDFAFALWDRQRDQLMLARDRMGVRPVYYTVQDGVLIFGSEVKALFQVPGLRAELDPIALSQCFTLLAPAGPSDGFQGHPGAAAGAPAGCPRRRGHRAAPTGSPVTRELPMRPRRRDPRPSWPRSSGPCCSTPPASASGPMSRSAPT